MRVAALYDLHGNLPALEAVLEEVRREGVELVVVGGDVYPGPLCEETLECLLTLDRPVRYLVGNGDRETLAVAAGEEPVTVPAAYRPMLQWVAARLTPEHRKAIRTWPASFELEVTGLGEVLFCHATPTSDAAIFTRETSEEKLRPVFRDVRPRVVLCGHTHMQFDRRVGTHRVVNAGSVGMPFGQPGACWALLGPTVELRRTEYDRAAAAARIRASSYPQAEEFVRDSLMNPPSEQAMLEVYAKAELREAG